MRLLAGYSLFIVALACLHGCSTHGQISKESVVVNGWVLVPAASMTFTFNEDRAPTLYIRKDAKTVDGHTGCNKYWAAVEMGPGTIDVKQVASTRMACPDVTWEPAFIARLEEATHFKVAGNKLYLMKDGEIVLKFKSGPIPEGQR